MKAKSLFWGLLSLMGLAVSCQPKVESEPSVKITGKAVIEVAKEGANEVISFTSATAWELRGLDDVDWLVADKMSGKGSANEQTINLQVAPNAGANRSASLTIYASPLAKKTVTINQTGEKGDGVDEITVADFIAGANTTTKYKLTGVVGEIVRSTSFYGFSLKDATGVVSCPFPANWDTYSAELHSGATVSVVGAYEYYASKEQHQVNDAEIVAHTPVDVNSVQKTTVADFISKADAFARYRLEGTVATTVNATYCSFDIQDETGSIYVYSVNNASEWGSKLKQGDKVVLVGAYELYEAKSQHEVVDCDIISSVEGAGTVTPTPDPTPEDALYYESFASSMGEWTINDVTKPDEVSAVWSYYASYTCMLASGYSNSTNYDTESWLISPVIDLSGKTSAYLEFEQAVNFFTDLATAKTQASVRIREENGTWATLTVPNYPAALSWSFTNSGSIDIKAYAGKKIQLAFVYLSTSAKAGSWEVKNVKITEKAQVVEESDFPADATISIAGHQTDFAEASDSSYGTGYSATIDGVTVSYFKHKSTSAPVAASTDHIRVYKSSVLKIDAGKSIKAVRLTVTDTKYAVSMTPLSPESLTVTPNTTSKTIVIEGGNASSYVLHAIDGQVRVSKIEIDYAE